MTTAYSLSNNSLLQFETTSPTTIVANIPVTGLGTGENLVGIDFRPQNGLLYGLTSNGAGAVRLYNINFRSGAAIPLTPEPVKFGDGTDPVAITGTSFGFDFNPAVDRIRVVTNTGFNFRINPNDGTLIDGNNGSTTVFPGVNPDGVIQGATTSVDAAAYTNNEANTTITTQYTLNSISNQLFIQNPPNSGIETNPLPLSLNSTPIDFTATGFDIPRGVNTASSNASTTGQALAVLNVAGRTGLYGIELSTGVLTALGDIGNGTVPTQGLALRNAGGVPIVGLDSLGTNLVRFNSSDPSTVFNVPVTGITPGETLVGIDFRPATGQLFGFGVNATANNGTVYQIDPQGGAARVVGTPGAIAFVDADRNPIDLPPASTGYGLDFNPAADRFRVTVSNGLNFRLNQLLGTPVDGDLGGVASSVAGINADGFVTGISSDSVGITATAYTSSVAGTTVTTQYTIDADNSQLFIQNPPNSGAQTNGLPITVGGNPLIFTSVNGFDIPPNVTTTTSNAPTTGLAFTALTVDGMSRLYQIELSTGVATNLGRIGTGTSSLSGLTVGDVITPLFFDLTNNDDGNASQPLDLSRLGNINRPVRGVGGNDNLLGTNGADTINGNQGNDTILGSNGNDLLFGGRGNDLLNGGSGNDTLIGDMSADTLIGGGGVDTFVLRNGDFAARNATGADLVTDFNLSERDLIGLNGGLTFNALTLETVTTLTGGTSVSSTLIRSGDDFLGILQGISPTSLTPASFVSITLP